jgi:hypothetical protein
VLAILVTSVTLLGNGELKDLSLVLFVGMLSGTYSSICIATPVLADLKEREPQYKKLRDQVALRNAGGRARLRKARLATGQAGAATVGTAVLEAAPDGDDDAIGVRSAAGLDAGDPEDTGLEPGADPGEFDQDGEPVAAGRPAAAARSGPPRPQARQQPRRTNSAKRRPAGKKKRR